MQSGPSSARLTLGDPSPSTIRLDPLQTQMPKSQPKQEADENIAIQMDDGEEAALPDEPEAADPETQDTPGNVDQEESNPGDAATRDEQKDKSPEKSKSVRIKPTPSKSVPNVQDSGMSFIDSCLMGVRRKLLPDQPKYLPAAKRLWEIVFYVVFLVNLSCVSLLMQDTRSFFLFNDSVQTSIVNAPFPQTPESPVTIDFTTLGSWADFWAFMRLQCVPILLNTGTVGVGNNDGTKYVLGSNILIGKIKIRQLRIRANISCPLPDQFNINTCYNIPNYDESFEQQKEYSLGKYTFTYKKGEYRYSSLYTGVLANYPDGGYFAETFLDYDKTISLVTDLEATNWLDSYTRAVFIDFTIYNPPTKLISTSRLVVETSEFGGFYSSSYIRTLSPFRIYTTRGIILSAFEGLLFVFVWYYTVREIQDMVTKGLREYFHDRWSIPDILSLLMFYIQFSMEGYVYYEVDSKLKNLPQNDNFNFFEIAFIQEQVKSLIAINTIVCFFRIFKYVSVHKRMGELTRTLSFARDDIMYFMVMFVFVFWGFTQAFHISFGSNVPKFSTLVGTLYALFTCLLGDIALNEITKDNRVLGPVLFFSFIILVFFVLVNMYLAIINQSYDEVRKAPPDDDHKILQAYIRRKYRQLRVKYLGGTDKPEIKSSESRAKLTPPMWSQSSRVLPLESMSRLHSHHSRKSRSERLIKVEPGDRSPAVKEASGTGLVVDSHGGLKQEAKLHSDNGGKESAGLDPSKLDILIEAVTSSVRQVAPSGGGDMGQSIGLMQESLVKIDGKFEKLYVKLEDLILILLEQNQSGQGGGDDGDDDYT